MRRKNITRRSFLGQASCAAVGGTSFLSSVLNLGAINTLAARPHILDNSQDYKALVCILLAGGADSYNMLVPTESSEYADYVATRSPSIALSNAPANNEILPLNYAPPGGRTFGVHYGMPDVQQLFNAKKLSFVSNIGTLIEPIKDVQEYKQKIKQVPLGLYSHNDQIMQWQTSVPQSRTAVGVGGRLADLIKSQNSIQEISMNLSLSGKNRFQAGNTVIEYSIKNTAQASSFGYEGLPSWYSDGGVLNKKRREVITSMVEKTYQDLFLDTYGGLVQQTDASIEILKNALSKAAYLTTPISDTNLSKDLNMMAKLISSRQYLGAKRQIFFTTFGGWDHHDNVKVNQAAMLPTLNNALAEFNASLVQLGLQDRVTTFTISDFSRTLTSNGNGSDHAWGGNTLIMGGAVKGGEIFGEYPSLRIQDNPFNLDSRGRLLPTTSVDEFYAELALWFGVSPNDLGYVLPNLCNFYSPNCTQPPSANYSPIGMFHTYG